MKWSLEETNYFMRCRRCNSTYLVAKTDTSDTQPCPYDHDAPKLMVPALPWGGGDGQQRKNGK